MNSAAVLRRKKLDQPNVSPDPTAWQILNGVDGRPKSRRISFMVRPLNRVPQLIGFLLILAGMVFLVLPRANNARLIEETDRQTESLRRRLDDAVEKLAIQGQGLGEQARMLQALGARLVQQGDTIGTQNRTLNDFSAKLKKQDDLIDLQTRALAAQSDKLSDQVALLAEQNDVLAAQDQKLAEQDAKLANQDSKLAEQDAKLADQDRLPEEYRKIIASIAKDRLKSMVDGVTQPSSH